MGPGGQVPTTQPGPFSNPPSFDTNVTLKVRYRNAFRKWIRKIKKISEIDPKDKTIRHVD